MVTFNHEFNCEYDFSCGVISNWTLEGAQGALFKLKGGQRSNVSPWKSGCV